MKAFITAAQISNKFPSIWNEADFAVSCPFGNHTIAEFEQFNRKVYTFKSNEELIAKLNDFCSNLKQVFQQSKILSIAIDHGVPLILVESKFPWDDPNDKIEQHGAKIDGIGIVYRKDVFDPSNVRHEMIHAIQTWMLEANIIPSPPKTEVEIVKLGFIPLRSDWFGVKTSTLVNDIFLRLRIEIQAYMIANSGRIANGRFEVICHSLTGYLPDELKNLLSPNHFESMINLVKISMALEKRCRQTKDSNTLARFIIDLLKHSDFDEYTAYLNKNYKELFKIG
ncbi:MAG: hypothetical protein ACRCXZ_05915 [Patescibacteria group bacterium]